MLRFALAETERQPAPAVLGHPDSERKRERLVLVATDVVTAPGFPAHSTNLEPTFLPATGTDGGMCREEPLDLGDEGKSCFSGNLV